MVVIVTRAGKGSPLTNAEVDANFVNLNDGIAAVPVGDVVGPAGATDNAIARFDTASGKLIQNSSALVTDAGQMAVNASATPPTISSMTALHVEAEGAFNAINLDTYGTAATIRGRTAPGTKAVPGSLGNGAIFATFAGSGRVPAGWATGGRAKIDYVATEAWTDTGNGARMIFNTTPNGTLTMTARWEIQDVGHFAPIGGGTYDIGSAAARVRTVYSGTGEFSGAVRANGFTAENYGNFAAFNGFQANGSVGAPTRTLSGQPLAVFQGIGRAPSGWGLGSAAFVTRAFEDWTDTAQGSGSYFSTTAVGSTATTPRWEFNAPGHFVPFSNSAYDIGTAALRVRKGYFDQGDFSGAVAAGPDGKLVMSGQAGVNTVLYFDNAAPVSAFAFDLVSGDLRWANRSNGAAITFKLNGNIETIGLFKQYGEFGLEFVEPRGKYYSSLNPQTTNYDLVLADQGRIIFPSHVTAGTPQTITIPLNSVVPFPVNARIDLTQWGTGVVSVVPTGGVTLVSSGNKRKLAAQYAGATLVKMGAPDIWLLVGDLIA